jgi:Caenorhabditis protein of unknown function, DUF268
VVLRGGRRYPAAVPLPPVSSRLKRLARRVVRPVASPIDGRVADINRRIGYQGEAVRGHIDRAESALATAIGSYAGASVEVTSYVGVELRQMAQMLGEMTEKLGEMTDKQGELASRTLDEYYRQRLADATGMPLEKLDEDLAWLLNHAAGHRGFAAQAELWFNAPVTVRLEAGGASLAQVNERIVEMPFAMGVLGRVPAPARILDVGSAESTFPLSAAALGYDVTAVDLRPLPYTHPNLASFTGRFEDWPAPSEPFSVVFLISTIEHVGLGAYGETPYGQVDPGEGSDRAMLARIRTLLAPRGLLVLTTPYGTGAVSNFERVYDEDSLAALLHGWEIRERRIVVRRSDVLWETAAAPEPGRAGVAMVVATPAV